MNEWLNTVLSQIAEGTLLPDAYFASLDCDHALDCRDSDEEFEAEWTRVSREVEKRWTSSQLGPELAKLAEDIRRESFLAVSRATQQHEIASYVSDDFDLIVRANLAGYADGFLGQLWKAYQRGEFPQPPLPE